jgi:TPP-dependent trihydroxycyclohexane-1,2-dione (THcHDO) dehydratase
MDNVTAAVIGSIFGGVAVALVNNVFQRRKIKAEATQIITDAANGVIKSLQEEVDRLKAEIRDLRRTERNLKRWAAHLVAQVKELGGVPIEYEEGEE